MAEKIKLYVFYLDEDGVEPVYGFRFFRYHDPDRPLPELKGQDVLIVTEKDLDEYQQIIDQIQHPDMYFLFEIEGDETVLTGMHCLSVLGLCETVEQADDMAEEMMAFENCWFDIVLDRRQALLMFQKPDDRFDPSLMSSFEYH